MEKITIQAEINKNSDKVWDCYTNQKHITEWNFADETWHCPSASNELRVGGKYKARMEAKDKSMGFDLEATYNEVSIGKSFIYTMTDGRVVSTNFDDRGAKTVVTITFDAENQNPIEFQKNGWQAILNNFKQYAENK